MLALDIGVQNYGVVGAETAPLIFSDSCPLFESQVDHIRTSHLIWSSQGAPWLPI